MKILENIIYNVFGSLWEFCFNLINKYLSKMMLVEKKKG